MDKNYFILFCPKSHGSWEMVALLDQPFQVWVYKYRNNLYCDQWKLKIFTMKKYNLQKNPLKETKILQDIITLL
jgi:hypothetical protein